MTLLSFLFLQYMLNLELYSFLITRFFLNTCLVGVPFYFMMQFFIYVLGKKCTNLSKKFICVLSFAMSALIYSVVLVVPFVLIHSPMPFVTILLSFVTLKIWSLFLLYGLMVSVPFYSMLWCFLRTFDKVLPNRSRWLTHSVPNFLISFTTTSLIFLFIVCLLLCAINSAVESGFVRS